MKQSHLYHMSMVGFDVEVVDATNKSLIGIKGKVIDETKNMLVLNCDKTLIKDQVILVVSYQGETFRIEGKKLVGRPDQRIK